MDNLKNILNKTLIIFLPFLFVTLLFLVLFKLQEKAPEISIIPPEVTSAPAPESLSQIRWATDSATLGVEKTLLGIEEELKKMDLGQTKLLPPVLDINVNLLEK